MVGCEDLLENSEPRRKKLTGLENCLCAALRGKQDGKNGLRRVVEGTQLMVGYAFLLIPMSFL
ncbi:hypothetical protein Pint_30959 [Pistacia integerrima]|uniref:Uncharacterized protein n=1 Tax=Pistacia integerrima TaxID=434235 RepID=A0ACC0XLX1_9ROSI|nr:hypothetical protein Pint_30959 [Pistacia integerrima]